MPPSWRLLGDRTAFDMLKQRGIDLPIIDTGEIAGEVRKHFPDGVDAALELVGTPSLPDTLRCVRVHGTVCFTGLLSNQWTVKRLLPDRLHPGGRAPHRVRRKGLRPSTVRPCSGCSKQSPTALCRVTVHHVYDGLDEVRQAHKDMENNAATGKLVVRVRH